MGFSGGLKKSSQERCAGVVGPDRRLGFGCAGVAVQDWRLGFGCARVAGQDRRLGSCFARAPGRDGKKGGRGGHETGDVELGGPI